MYAVISDTSANLDVNIIRERDIGIIPFSYLMDGHDHICYDSSVFSGHDFYDAMRGGAAVATSQIPPARYADFFRPYLDSGKDILFVAMSSGLSSSFSSAQMAAIELREEYPNRTVCLVDSIGASLGEGLLALKAADMRDAGMSAADAADCLLGMRRRMCNLFTVDDLKYLRRTGRLSGISTAVGTVLNIKPLLKGDTDGKIVCFQRSRGRRKAIEALADYYDRYVRDAGEQTVGIAHADCAEDAELLTRLLKRKYPPRDIMTVMYEPVTGSHVGPGTLALFFLGDESFRGAR